MFSFKTSGILAATTVAAGILGSAPLAAYAGAGTAQQHPEGVSIAHQHPEGVRIAHQHPDGVRIARKHLGWYARDRPENARFRAVVNAAETPDAQLRLTNDYFERLAEAHDLAA